MGMALKKMKYTKKTKIKILDDFINKNNLDLEDNLNIIKKTNLINTRDNLKFQLATVLLNNWMVYEVYENEYVFVKHILSPKENLLYQIILSEDDFSGIYEFQFVGKKINLSLEEKNNCTYLGVQSKGNFGLADLNNNVVCRMEQSEKDFIKSLHEFISIEELNLYYKPKLKVKEYLIRNLPRLNLKCD